MALFKSRKAGDDAATAPRQPESIEAMRRRARHRLIGAGVLVLIGVVGFPLLFDTQPRPIAVDIPIEIPDRDKVKPLQAPKPAAQAPAVSGAVIPAPPVALAPPPAAAKAQPASAAVAARETPLPAPTPETKVAAVTTAKPEPAAAAPRAVAKTEARPAEPAKAKAAETRTAAAAPAEGRFVVQVGSFADAARARDVRLKVERAGLKTYTHVAETKEGRRIRVRVGPFETRSEADKAASKIKGLDMPAAILTL